MTQDKSSGRTQVSGHSADTRGMAPTQILNIILDELYAAEDYAQTLAAMDKIHAFMAVETNRTSSVLAELKLAEIQTDWDQD